MESDDITLKDVIGHMQAIKSDLIHEIRGLGTRMDNLEGKVDRMDRRLTGQIDMLDRRLDRMEITMISQNHESRIIRLEKHVKLTV